MSSRLHCSRLRCPSRRCPGCMFKSAGSVCTYTYTYANLTRSTQQPTETGPGGRLTRTFSFQDLKLSTFENGCSVPRPTARNLRRRTYRRRCRVRLLMSWEDTYVPTLPPSPSPSPRRSGRAAACVVYARCSVLGARYLNDISTMSTWVLAI